MAKAQTEWQPSRKEQIIKTAAGLFKKKGYNATTMRHLAEQTGMEAASLYNHIRSKGELLQEICFGVAAMFTESLEGIIKRKESPLQKIERIIAFHIDASLQHFEEVYVSNRDWKHLKEPFITQFLQQRRQYETKFANIIQQGIAKGEIREVHPYVAVLTLLSAVRSIEFWHRNKRGISSRQIREDLTTLLLQGLRADS